MTNRFRTFLTMLLALTFMITVRPVTTYADTSTGETNAREMESDYASYRTWGNPLEHHSETHNWTIKLNRHVDENSVDDSSVYIIDENDNKLDFIHAETENSGIHGSIVLKNSGSFIKGEDYRIIIEDSVQSIDGKKLSKGLKAPFKINELINDITSAGTYGPAEGTATISDNVTISSQDVTLQNVVIEGNLILAEGIGEGDFHLKGVTVKGDTIVNGGGENSIYFTDSVLATVLVNKNNGAVRIVAQGNTQVYEVQLETPTYVVEKNLKEEASGFENIVVSETMQSTGEYQVKLEGQFETINSRATNVKIELSASTNIETIILNALAEVLGEGTIGTAQINANGSTISQKPQNVVLDTGVYSVYIDQEEIYNSYSNNEVVTIQSIYATQGSIFLEMDSFVAGLSSKDFLVTATIDGNEYHLEDVYYNSAHQQIMFNSIPLMNNMGKKVEITVASNSNKVKGESLTDSFKIGTGFSGRITDVHGVGASNLTIKFRAGTGTKSGAVVGEVTTDAYGYYSVNLPVGTYTGEFTGLGYITSYMIGTAASDYFLKDQHETAIRTAASNEVKIMLSWDEYPQDLDSHLTGPGSDDTLFHIAYYNKQEIQDGVTYVDLDWDDVDSYGPETTTIRRLVDGEYNFYIHHYSGKSTLSLSGAKVEVFLGNSKTPNHVFEVPADGSDEIYWAVFDLKVSEQGQKIEIEPVDQLVAEEYPQFVIDGTSTENYWYADEYVAVGSLLEITASEGTEIRYTMGEYNFGDVMDSPIYTAPIEITKSTWIEATAIKHGVIVGTNQVYLHVLDLETAKNRVEEVESLLNSEDFYYAVEIYDYAKRIVNMLEPSAEKTDLENRLTIAEEAIASALENIEE